MKTFRAALLLFTVAIVLWACPYKSNVGMDDGPSIKIDKAVLGTWHKAGYPADSTELIFTKSGAEKYILNALIKYGEDYENHHYSAWFSSLSNWQLLTLYDTESKEYSFGEIVVENKQLGLKLLSDEITSQQFTSVSAMKVFLESLYTENKVLYDKDVDLTGLVKKK
jgi:hypothetical protein